MGGVGIQVLFGLSTDFFVALLVDFDDSTRLLSCKVQLGESREDLMLPSSPIVSLERALLSMAGRQNCFRVPPCLHVLKQVTVSTLMCVTCECELCNGCCATGRRERKRKGHCCRKRLVDLGTHT